MNGTIADALGQRIIAMARHNAKDAGLAPKMRAVVASLDAEFEKRFRDRVRPRA